jgi:hypothetical protein
MTRMSKRVSLVPLGSTLILGGVLCAGYFSGCIQPGPTRGRPYYWSSWRSGSSWGHSSGGHGHTPSIRGGFGGTGYSVGG